MAKIKPVKPGTTKESRTDETPSAEADARDATTRKTRGITDNSNATTRKTRGLIENSNATTRKTRGLVENSNATTRQVV